MSDQAPTELEVWQNLNNELQALRIEVKRLKNPDWELLYKQEAKLLFEMAGKIDSLQFLIENYKIKLMELEEAVVDANDTLWTIIQSYGYKLTPEFAYKLAMEWFDKKHGLLVEEIEGAKEARVALGEK